MVNVTGTHINYYYICKRKLWFNLNNLSLENTNNDVLIGKIIEENTYKRRNKNHIQVLLDNINIDYVDIKNKILYETKKTDKNINSAIMQMKYYLFIINDMKYKGIIEIPQQRKKYDVLLLNSDIENFNNIIKEIHNIKNNKCPIFEIKPICKSCSFYEFCVI